MIGMQSDYFKIVINYAVYYIEDTAEYLYTCLT